MLDPYEYEPLEGERFIRVLKILSKANERPLRCSLKAIDLNRAPVYDCLSYTWGDPLYHELSARDPSLIRRMTGSLDHEIECDGKMIPITENLEDALLQFSRTSFISQPVKGRQNNDEGFIWIDAICIEQKNVIEKNVQIAMMDQIYSGARRVIAWLGPCDEHTHPALEIIERLKFVLSLKLQVTFTDFEGPEYKSVFGDPPISSQQWNGYAAFIQRAWFNRVWIMQEAFLAKHIDVLCGSHVLSWEHDISEVAKFLQKTNLGNLIMAQAFDSAHPDQKTTVYVNNSLNQYHLEAMKSNGTKKPLPLEALLAYSRYFQAERAQDHVYGLLGIWKSSNKEKELPKDMMINQSLNQQSDDFVASVFIQYSWASIRNTNDLHILSLVDDPSTRKQKKLPSWVPDYSVGFHVHPLAGVLRPSSGLYRWHASNGLPPFDVPSVPTSSLRKLPVKGILFDSIDETTTTYSEVMDKYDIKSLLDLLLHYPAKTYPTACTPVEAFWRTLIKDSFRQGPANDEARDAFQYLIAGRVGHLEDASQGLEGDVDPNELVSLLDKTKSTIEGISYKYKNNTVIPDLETIDGILEEVCSLDPASDRKKKVDRDFDHMFESFRVAYSCRRFFRTKKNYLGIVAESVKKGDALWVLAGATVPLVLRPVDDGGWELVGEAYVHGIMNGEVVKVMGKELQHIDLI